MQDPLSLVGLVRRALRFIGMFGLSLAGGSLLAATPSAKPSIVFILADDLGYTDVACYGSTYYETPNIDRLAAQGVRFTSGYTCGPNCQPTRAALMSGQYGPRTGIYTVGSIDRFDWQSRPLRPVDNVEKLAPEKITIAEALKKAGYVTGLFGKWHLARIRSIIPAIRASTRPSCLWGSTSTSTRTRRWTARRAPTLPISSPTKQWILCGATRASRSSSVCTTSRSTRRIRPGRT
jgi:hypothetical protein